MKNMEEWDMQHKLRNVGSLGILGILGILPEYWEYCQNIARIL